jgi:hypothetical protein
VKSRAALETGDRQQQRVGHRPPRPSRRSFLKGAGGVAIGLPFLEGLPERSAWAADAPPVFSFYLVAANGVVGKSFLPAATGPLTEASLSAATGLATSVLAPHAPNLMFVRGIGFPMSPTGDSHAQGLSQVLTARPSVGGGSSAKGSGISADMYIAAAVNPGGADPLTLYAGNRRNGYIAERLSFTSSGVTRAADDNPYTLYAKLVGGGVVNPGMLAELVAKRKSVNDFVREELTSLMGRPALSSADRQRLKQHFDSLRDAETTMGTMVANCTAAGLSTSKLDALKDGLVFKMDGMIEDVVKLQMELVALAFACNFNRVATLQWGDGTDQTKYKVASNANLGWTFHHISHRTQSDSAVASDTQTPAAVLAHAEIDVLRMQTFKYGLDAFASRGLADKAIVMWTNHIADGPSHSYRNVPTIIWGNGGGYLRPGAYVDAGNVTNNKLFNTLITAAIRDKVTTPVDFGMGTGTGEIAVMKA